MQQITLDNLNITHTKLERIDSESGFRFYKTPKGKFPSITTVLSHTSDSTHLDEWRNRIGIEEANNISKAATDAGTGMHTLFEEFIKDELTCEEFSKLLNSSIPRSRLFFKQLKPLLIRTISSYVGFELQLYSAELGIAGSTDLVATMSKEECLCILDYKGNNKLNSLKKEEWLEDYKIQVSAYAKMFEHQYKHRVPKGVILMTNGIVNQKFIFDTEEYQGKLKARIAQFNLKYNRNISGVDNNQQTL